ncbi:uncharacterized protein LOC107432758 isoform X2 [Ziziphus jujuba]|uniref:Uncharacterized protein LOC107432758 isoform X2 n=1 Tax=Ziziphus jujuba TaxID=326968 RepID=A0ABM3I538_ZIZJJ|nr:uncharacterized protein LOC107432758 isoform X2 [Ziziphus jujuba]XP_048320783.2 uncharacterized protein LOC107432758 isoform X2 [Ziziphus jujuba]
MKFLFSIQTSCLFFTRWQVNAEPDVGEDAFAWFGSLVPLVTDLVNGRFTFETLTASTGHRLHFPAYDRFLKEIDKCIKHLRKQAKPTGVELADDEFILHVEGTPTSQRVVRHIGATSWPGRLTLTNYALYFEASGVIRYEDALKINLSKNIEQNVKAAATGPWGAPLFDKAMAYESPELSEEIVLEFPEITSSTRRDHWLAITREIMLMHQFLQNFKVESSIQAWEMHARTILCIIRLHAAREMLRISTPAPTKFLIFSLFNELPKGDYVLEELAENLKKTNSGHPCSASSILRCMNTTEIALSSGEKVQEIDKESLKGQVDDFSSLETAIDQAREEEKEAAVAKATTQGLKEEGISHSTLVLIELLKPLKNLLPLLQEVVMWERPAATLSVTSAALIITYKEWVGKAIAALIFWLIAVMIMARKARISEKCNEIVICTASDSTAMESIVSAQHGLQTLHEMVQKANITLLKLWSIFVSKARKHADIVMMGMSGVAILLALVPTKYIIMGLILYGFSATSKVGNHFGSHQGNRRLKEWWDSIPVVPVRVVDKLPEGHPT